MHTGNVVGSEDYLLTLAELAATFAGLAAIITVLRGPRHRPWTPREKIGLWGLLAPSLGSFLLALAPHPFLMLGASPDAVWRSLSGVVAIGWLAGGWSAVRALRRATALGYPDPTPFSNAALIVAGTASLILALLNAAGVFGRASGAVFALSLLSSLGFSVVIFATFLYASTSFSHSARQRAEAAGDASGGADPAVGTGGGVER